MPAGLSFAEDAAVPYGAGEALRFLRKGGIDAGQRVLIIGAGGSFGTYAVKLVKHAGAEVVAVDSAGKLEMLRELGADQVIDCAEWNFTDGPGDFDIVFEVVGRAPFGRIARLLRHGGRYVVANPHAAQFFRGLWASRTSDKKTIFGSGTGKEEHLRVVTELVEADEPRLVVDREYPVEQLAGFGGETDRDVVADDLEGDLVDDLRDHRVDHPRHDARARLHRGRLISPGPARGPEDRSLRSLQIVDSCTAMRLSTPENWTNDAGS
jgi:SAM-dependent methyltransferase